MAYKSLFTYLACFSLISSFCHSFNPKLLNVSKAYYDQYDPNTWPSTFATWYGNVNAGGSDGGSCGYQYAVESAPFYTKITALAPSLYNSGQGCGNCYQVKCVTATSKFCSGKPVTVVATDSCPGCDHLFDLSGPSFGAMANPGQADELRGVGRLSIQYTSVDCEFMDVDVAFRVDPGSNSNYFAVAVEYENGKSLIGVDIKQANSSENWLPMKKSWGAVWMVNFPNSYSGPFSIRLTENSSKQIVAASVIPAYYTANQVYKSSVNF